MAHLTAAVVVRRNSPALYYWEWPASLRALTSHMALISPLDSVVWPKSLQQLTFVETFNQTISGTGWPASLVRDCLQANKFPGSHGRASLKQLKFGRKLV